MLDENTAELVLTADGNTKNIVFVEDLVNSAPKIDRWKFTALKEPMNEGFAIKMGDYEFNSENIKFYAKELVDYPDEIDIIVVHDNLTEENREEISNGTYIFLDNYLGELDFLTHIDNLNIIGNHEVQKELVPITKLKDFLNWRQKEFIEKYDGVRYNSDSDNFCLLEAELDSGNKLLAVLNSDLLNWHSKASHPWISVLALKYDGKQKNGMPNDYDYDLLNAIEEEIIQQLKAEHGYLNIGRQTADNEREIYFACKEFRKPSKVFYHIQQKYSDNFEIEYTIYKDKYWQSFERFKQGN